MGVNGMDAARSGMLAYSASLDIVANNIANVNTAGFHVQEPHLADVAPEGGVAADNKPTASGVTLLGVDRIFTPGPPEQTGQPFDLYIDGGGFFAVKGPDGAVRYTREGRFHIAANGALVDGDGMPLDPPVKVPLPPPAELAVDAKGQVVYQDENGAIQVAGTVKLFRFANPGGLLATGDNRLVPTAASGDAQEATLDGGPGGRIVSGALEGSNTDLVEQMTAMLQAQRAYQLNLESFSTADEMLKALNQFQA